MSPMVKLGKQRIVWLSKTQGKVWLLRDTWASDDGAGLNTVKVLLCVDQKRNPKNKYAITRTTTTTIIIVARVETPAFCLFSEDVMSKNIPCFHY